MESTGGPRNVTDPPRRRTEYGYLFLGVIALTAAAVTFVISQLSPVATPPQGLYSILASLWAVGGCGWIVRSGDAARARALAAGKNELRRELADLTCVVADLSDQLAAIRAEPADRPAPISAVSRRVIGHRYFGAAAVGGVGDTAPSRTGLDPQAIADARSIARRLVDADTLARQDRQP